MSDSDWAKDFFLLLKIHGHKHKELFAFFALVGAYNVTSTLLNYSWRLFKTFLRPSRDLFKRYQGGYVLITGGTDGLGFEYARQFAQKGFNLVLVARNEQKLEDKKKDLHKEFEGIDIKTITFDFDIPYTPEGYAPLKEAFDKLEDISVLINNVGAIGFDYFNDMDIETMNRMIQVNCVPQCVVTKFLLPKLLKRSKDGKRTAIINLSSVAYYTNLTRTAVYCATKSFNKSLSVVLKKEYGEHIDVLAVLPGPTRSNMITFDAPLVIQPQQHVKWALSDLGYNTETFGHYQHWIYTNAYSLPLFEGWYNALRQRRILENEKKQAK